MASIMAGLPKVIASRPEDRRRSRLRPHATALDAQCQAREGQTLTRVNSDSDATRAAPPSARESRRSILARGSGRGG